ncbi:MAG: T9SS type A sorting domain-containing protein, partial [Bacteroidales bacterium]
SSVLADKVYSLSVNFIISSNYYFRNTDKTIERLIIDFGDGIGFNEYNIEEGYSYLQEVNYTTFGIKEITIKAITSIGDTLTCISKINIQEKITYVFLTDPKNISLTAKIPFQYNEHEFDVDENGYSQIKMKYGKADMRIYFSDSSFHDRKIRKPILIVDGFDPGNTRQFERDLGDKDNGGIWGQLRYDSIHENGTIKKIHIGDELLKKGYDIILLDFPYIYDTTLTIIRNHYLHSLPQTTTAYVPKYNDFGSTFIERNAYTCIVAIDTINQILKENGSKEQLVIIGPSMGGQITRFALKYMEDSLPSRDYRGHNTRLWASFDSPHQGANISLGAQAFIWSNSCNNFNFQLYNPAACEMLLFHRGSKVNGSYTQQPQFHRYYNKINKMGFPSKLRKVAITNGSLNGTKTGNAEKYVFGVRAFLAYEVGHIWMSPSYPTPSHEVYKGRGDDVDQLTSSNQYGCNYDIAPGGTFPTFKEVYDQSKLWYTCRTDLNQYDHCFMPTKSTLAYNDTNNVNLCENLSDRDLVVEGIIPFDNYWGSPNINMGHVTFNSLLHEWFNKELDIYIIGERELSLCSTYQYTINSLDLDDTIQWECSYNLQITSDPRNHTLTIKALQLGNGWIRAINSPDYRKDTLAFYQIQVSSTDFIAKNKTTGNTTWNTDLNIGTDFTVKTGHTLTIQNAKISIAPDIKIKIEPGAKLIIDNSTLTNYCGSNYWGGIEVFGIKKQLQAEQYQGTLIVKNNSIIENSRNAISTWRTNDWNSTGGIVKAENSTFRNNIRSAEFLSYKNTNSNTGEQSNVSRFTNCTFTWDRSMFPHDKTSLSHVTLWDVKDVMFIGCDFTDNQILNNSIIKHGILAEDAGFKVLAKISITPQGYNVDKSSFTKLSYGIRVSNTEKSVEVMDSYFGDNFCGVFATTANSTTIKNNEFHLIPVYNIRELYPTEPAYGVVLDKSKIYKLEQNNFFGEDKNLKAIGLQVKNLGASPIIIKNNTFRDILYSTIAIGKNRGTNNIGESVGVKYNCNDFIATNYGISVIRDKNANNESWYGIDLYQNGGNVTQPAENIFDNKEYPLYSDIYIEDDINTYTYFYNADESTKNPLSISPNILKNPASNETDCSRDYGILNDFELHNHHTFIENEYLTLLYNYNNLLDGGSKDELLDKLLDSWEGDVWDLRQAYLDASPYLSSDVLKELALSEKLPLAVYLEVALSNPEGTQKDEYIEFMNTEEGENFLTPTGIELIKGSWDTKTFRATLESNISSKLSDMEEVSRTIIYRILNDSTGVNISNYRDILYSIRNIEAKYELVDSYIETKEYNTAENLLNTLLADPNNEKYNADDINDYLLLLSIMRDKNDTTNLIPIDERLETLSNSSTRAGAKAKAYLYFNNQETDYHPDYVDLDLKEKSKTNRRAKPSLTQLFGADVTISPNPAKDHIILTYDLPSKQVYTIKIYDNKGIELLTKTLNSNKGVQTIELKNLKSGAYYYSITDSKGVIKSDKLIIVK